MKILSSILGVTIPIPIILIPIVVLLWTGASYWDKSAAIKDAVESRVTEMVAGAEIEKLREQIAAEKVRTDLLRQINERATEQMVNAELALREYQQDAEKENDDLQERINRLLESDGTGIGTVGPVLYERLPDK